MRFERGLLIGWVIFCAVMFSLTIAVFVASTVHVWGEGRNTMSAHRDRPLPDTSNLLVLPFPVRPNYIAQVVLPKDLTVDEARRLSVFIMALCKPEGTT